MVDSTQPLAPSTDPLALSPEPEVQEQSRLWLAMTAKQQAYCTARLEGCDENQAKQIAGYDRRGHPEAHPKIARYIALSTKSALRNNVVNREDVIRGLLDAVDSAGTSMELTQAWREIGRVIGAYAPEKFEVNTKVEDLTAKRLAEMKTEELITLTQRNGVYEVDLAEDPSGEEYAAFREALREPEPITQDQDQDEEV